MRETYKLWVVMLLTSTAGLGAFRAPTSFAVSRSGMQPVRSVMADFNRDGIPDVAFATLPASGSANPGRGGISVLLGARNSPFTALTELPATGIPNFIVAADFNRDNIPDLGAVEIFFGGSGSDFCVFLGNGSGGFSAAPCISMDKMGAQPVVADFNRDSLVDVAVPQGIYNSVVTLLGNGPGTFRNGSEFATAAPYFVAAADWTGDGVPDLAIYNPAGSLLIARGNGVGGFTAGQTLSAPPNGGQVGAADLNGDGRPEIVIPGAAEGGPATIFRANGTGFNTGVPYAMPQGSGAQRQVRFADADGDGDVDVWVTVQNNAWVLFNDGNGGFVLSSGALVINLIADFLLGDFNSDGLLDIVTTYYGVNGAEAAVLLGERAVSFLQMTPAVSVASFGQAVRLVATVQSAPGAAMNGGTMQLLDNGAVVGTVAITPLPVPSPLPVLPPGSNIPVGFANFDATLPVGSHLVSVFFPGTAAVAASTSPTVKVDVTKATSNTRLSGSEFVIQRSSPAAIPVNVDSGTSVVNEGTVRFVVNGQPLASAPVANGVAQLRLPANMLLGPVRGSMQFESANYLPSSSAEIGVVVQGSFVLVSGAYPQGGVARDGIATLALPGLVAEPQVAATIPWPGKMSRVELEMAGVGDVFVPATLAYVGPNQINFLVPLEIPEGQRTLRVKQDGVAIAQGQVAVAGIVPGIFTADSSGGGVPAALAGLYGSGGVETVAVFNCVARCVPAAMPLGSGEQVLVLSLYATGFRNSSLQVRATAGGQQAEVLFAGAHPVIPGMDQINVKFDKAVFRAGEFDLVLTVDGRSANTVRVAFR